MKAWGKKRLRTGHLRKYRLDALGGNLQEQCDKSKLTKKLYWNLNKESLR
jgi:hypothetical protein